MQFLYVAWTHSRGTLLPRRTVPGGSWGAPDSIEVRTRMEGEKKKKKEEKKKRIRDNEVRTKENSRQGLCKETRDAAICNRVTQLW